MENFEKLIDPKERRRLIAYIKAKYPVGTEVWDDCRSGPFTIRKNSIFAVAEDDDLVRSEEEMVGLEFLVRKPGKYTDFWQVERTIRKYTRL
jgi:hypothetical protein